MWQERVMQTTQQHPYRQKRQPLGFEQRFEAEDSPFQTAAWETCSQPWH